MEPDQDPDNAMTKCTTAIYDGTSQEVQTEIDFTDLTRGNISSLGQNNQREERLQEGNEELREIEDNIWDSQTNRNTNYKEDEGEGSINSDQNEDRGDSDNTGQQLQSVQEHQKTQQQEPQSTADPSGRGLKVYTVHV